MGDVYAAGDGAEYGGYVCLGGGVWVFWAGDEGEGGVDGSAGEGEVDGFGGVFEEVSIGFEVRSLRR